MKIEEVFIVIGFIAFCLAIVYYFGQCMSLNTSIIEGLENKPDESAKPLGGLAGGAAASTDAIKAMTVKIQDELLIDKYKDDYVKKIIAIDDLIDAQMLKTALSFTPETGITLSGLIKEIFPMKMGRDALNDVMKTLDKGGVSSTTTTTTSSSFGF